MALLTQGTRLFFAAGEPLALNMMTCPTGITGLGSAIDQIDTTCLGNKMDRTYAAGLGSPAQVSVPFIFKPEAIDQRLLLDSKETRVELEWMIAFSDTTTDPTLTAGDIVFPSTGTSASFRGYIADINFDVASNEVVRGTMTIQRSGNVDWNFTGAGEVNPGEE